MKNNTISAPKFAQIMGINVSITSVAEVLARVNFFVSHSDKFSIVTPNSELVLMAQDNIQLRNAMNSTDLPVPDGVGLNYASLFLFGKPLNIIPGRKLFVELIKLANDNKWRVFLLGGMDNEADVAGGELSKKFKTLKILSAKGPRLDKNGELVTEADRKSYKDLIDKINKFSPQILFVAFGNPKQEIWIHNNLSKINVGGAMAVGGTFRYIAGISKLPPKWMEKFGLEWLWRLITEPFRFKRIWNAVVLFPLKVLQYKITDSGK